jgi:hypothetical protein
MSYMHEVTGKRALAICKNNWDDHRTKAISELIALRSRKLCSLMRIHQEEICILVTHRF